MSSGRYFKPQGHKYGILVDHKDIQEEIAGHRLLATGTQMVLVICNTTNGRVKGCVVYFRVIGRWCPIMFPENIENPKQPDGDSSCQTAQDARVIEGTLSVDALQTDQGDVVFAKQATEKLDSSTEPTEVPHAQDPASQVDASLKMSETSKGAFTESGTKSCGSAQDEVPENQESGAIEEFVRALDLLQNHLYNESDSNATQANNGGSQSVALTNSPTNGNNGQNENGIDGVSDNESDESEDSEDTDDYEDCCSVVVPDDEYLTDIFGSDKPKDTHVHVGFPQRR